MDNINIDEYLNKVDGNHLTAEEWNTLHEIIQSKTNELVTASNELNNLIALIRDKFDVNNVSVSGNIEMSSDSSIVFDVDSSVGLNTDNVLVANGDEGVYLAVGGRNVIEAVYDEDAEKEKAIVNTDLQVVGDLKPAKGINASFDINGIRYTFSKGILTSQDIINPGGFQ